MNLSEILPEPHTGWELHANGGYYKMIGNTKFYRYIAPCKENIRNDNFHAEIGLYSKSPFTNQESLKRKFSWIMAEFSCIRQFHMRNVGSELLILRG